MEIEKIYAELNKKLADAERVLVGLGAEWKVKDAEREAQVMEAKTKLKEMLKGNRQQLFTIQWNLSREMA